MALGFSNAALPSLIPLQRSHSENQIEAELKRLFLDLFRAKLAAKVFDANALGMPHIGSLDLVRRAVNADGLALLQGAREEAATRYLYRAWKSRNAQGRGLHFLRTYLQMLFPGACEVNQLWHIKDHPYPHGLVATDRPRSWWLHQLGKPDLKLNGAWGVGRRIPDAQPARVEGPVGTDDLFLTSRIDIAVDFSVDVPSVAGLLHIIRSIIPARMVPSFRFLMGVDVFATAAFVSSLLMQKSLSARLDWPGRVIGDGGDAAWRLGVDASFLRLPKVPDRLKIGRFKLGERRGGVSSWRLKSERIQSDAVMSSVVDLPAAGMPKVGDSWRRIDGSWGLSRRAIHAGSSAAMSSKCDVVTPSSAHVIFADQLRIDLQGNPTRLGRLAKLTQWRRLDGLWSVGEASPRPFGFQIRRDESILTDSRSAVEKRLDCGQPLSSTRLARSSAIKLARIGRKLNGSWSVGFENHSRRRVDGSWVLGFCAVQASRSAAISSASDIATQSSVQTTFSERARIDLQGTPDRLGRYPGLAQWRRLDGRWAVGEASRPFGFALRRDEPIPIESGAAMSRTATATVGRSPKISDPGRRIDGSWGVGRRTLHIGHSATMSSESGATVPSAAQIAFSEQIRMDLRGLPTRLGSLPRLTRWHRLDGRWAVGKASRPFGFPIRSDESIPVGSEATLEKRLDFGAMLSSERLARPAAVKLARTTRQLDGSWFVGSENKVGLFKLDGRMLRANRLTSCHRLGSFSVSREIPGVSTYDRGPARRLKLDGGWLVGRIAGPEVAIKVSRLV